MSGSPFRRSLFRRAALAALLALACLCVGQLGLAQDSSKLLAEARRCQRIAAERANAADECCVDWYFEAAYRASQAAHSAGKGDELVAESNLLYRENLQHLLGAGQQFGRLNPASGLHVQGSMVPVTHHS